jgi:hypothetical protein
MFCGAFNFLTSFELQAIVYAFGNCLIILVILSRQLVTGLLCLIILLVEIDLQRTQHRTSFGLAQTIIVAFAQTPFDERRVAKMQPD